jgi:Tfp pilus assembly protein FimT
MTELLVVVGIIAAMAAVALPNIAGWFRSYKIRAAASQVASDISAARLKAIMKNVNYGVIFVITANNKYRWIVEDDQDPSDGITATRVTPATLVTQSPQVGPEQTLPQGVTFVACTGVSSGDLMSGMRFRRLGDWCYPTGTGEPCPNNFWSTSGTQLIGNTSGTGASVCLQQQGSTLTRQILVSPGGRVRTQQ